MDGKGKRLDVHQPTKLYQFRKFDRNRYCRYMMDLVLRIQIKNLATLRRRRSLRLRGDNYIINFNLFSELQAGRNFIL